MIKILAEKEVLNGEDLLKMGKAGELKDTYTNENGEVSTKLLGRFCYISKAAREAYDNCAVSNLSVVELTTEDSETGEKGSFLRMQKAGVTLKPKTGDWH